MRVAASKDAVRAGLSATQNYQPGGVPDYDSLTPFSTPEIPRIALANLIRSPETQPCGEGAMAQEATSYSILMIPPQLNAWRGLIRLFDPRPPKVHQHPMSDENSKAMPLLRGENPEPKKAYS